MSIKEKTIKSIFDKHYRNLCFFAYTLIGDKISAEDFAQEAFVALIDRFEVLNPNDNVYRSFLYSSVKNSILNLHRRSKVELRYHQLTPFSDFDDIDFENAIIKTETIVEINNLIRKLPISCQEIFKLYYLEGLSTKEIALQLNLSINTIKTQKLRGLKFIQSKLNPEFFMTLIFLIK